MTLRLPVAFLTSLTIISLAFAEEALPDSTSLSPRTARASATKDKVPAIEIAPQSEVPAIAESDRLLEANIGFQSAGHLDDAKDSKHCTAKQELHIAREKLAKRAKEVVRLKEELRELRSLSEPVPIQVSFRVLDVSLTKLRDLGLESDFVTVLFADPKKQVCSRIVQDSVNLNRVIDSLIENNVAKILADVTMMSTNGHPAMYHSGGELPLTRIAADVQDPTGFAKFGTIAEVNPTLLKKDRLKLNFAIRLIDIDRSFAIGEGEQKTPGFRKKEASTTIILAPGQTHLTSSMQFNRVESSIRRKVVEDTVHEFQTLFLVTAEFPAAEIKND